MADDAGKLDKLRDILGEIMRDGPNKAGQPRIVAEYVDGQWMMVPLEINGKEYTVTEAVKYLQSNGWIDPRTGQDWSQAFKTQADTESAIRQRIERQDTTRERAPIEIDKLGPMLGDDDDRPAPGHETVRASTS